MGDIVIYDPLEEERKAKESKEKQLENLELNDVKLSDEDSSNDEDKEEKNKVKQDRKSKITEKDIGHSKGKKNVPSITNTLTAEKEDDEVPSKAKDEQKLAKKKKQAEEKAHEEATEDSDQKLKSMATRVLLPKGAKKLDKSESESEKEREKIDSDGVGNSPGSKEQHDDTSEKRMMIAIEKLPIPEELCRIKSIGRGRGTKKVYLCQVCENQFDKADKIKFHLYNNHYDDFIRCSDSIPKILTKPKLSDNKGSMTTEENTKEKEEKTIISKPSALARIFKRKGPKKISNLRDNVKPKESKEEIEEKKYSDDDIRSSVFDFEETEMTKSSSLPSNISDSVITSDTAENVLHSTVELKNSKNQETMDSISIIEEDSKKSETKAKRRNSKSPRGVRIEEQSLAEAGLKNQSNTEKDEKNILTSTNKQLVPSSNVPSNSVVLSPKCSFNSTEAASLSKIAQKVSESIQLSPRLDSGPIFEKEKPENLLSTSEVTGSFIAKSVSLTPRNEDSNISNEPKFGSHKNLPTFADLAMKSKVQAAKAIISKPRGRPPGRPKKSWQEKSISKG